MKSAGSKFLTAINAVALFFLGVAITCVVTVEVVTGQPVDFEYRVLVGWKGYAIAAVLFQATVYVARHVQDRTNP